jgi:hypothetical protein
MQMSPSPLKNNLVRALGQVGQVDFGAAASIVACATSTSAVLRWWHTRPVRVVRRALQGSNTSADPSAPPEWRVDRAELFAPMVRFVDSHTLSYATTGTTDQFSYVVSGPASSGKTSGVALALEGRNCVVNLRMGEDSDLGLNKVLLSELGIADAKFDIKTTAQTINEACRGVCPAVVVVDVSEGVQGDKVRAIGIQLKVRLPRE